MEMPGIEPAAFHMLLHYKLSAVLLLTLTHVSLGLTKHWPCFFAWSYKALAMLVDCMCSFGWRLEGGGEDHKACNLFELAISYCGF